jgi:RNA polymerase sigma-70 factor (ECF subfamily)
VGQWWRDWRDQSRQDADDSILLDGARRGESEAFGQLVARHFGRVYAVALAITGNPDDAEDVVQDALAIALERLEECRSGSSFGPWLRQIARSRALNAQRAARVRAAVSLEGLEERLAEPGAPGDPVLRARLLEALALLPEAQREVLLLHDLAGCPHAEIARTLGLTAGTCRVYLHAARQRMRGLLQGCV